jgi:hypothetical protein
VCRWSALRPAWGQFRSLTRSSARARQLQYFNKHAYSEEEQLLYLKRVGGALAGVASLGGLYYVTHLETVYLTGRRRFVAVSEETEEAMGTKAFEEVCFVSPANTMDGQPWLVSGPGEQRR